MNIDKNSWLPFKEGDTPEAHLHRAVLQIRCSQGKLSAPVVLLASLIILVALWDSPVRLNLLIWLALECGFIIIAMMVMQYIGPKIQMVDAPQLMRYRWLTVTLTAINSIIVGSVFWLVGLGAPTEVLLVITMIACLYCIGALANISVDSYSFPISLLLILGQGVLFFSGLFGGAQHFAVASTIAAAAVMLFSFGRINAKQFSETIGIRTENNLLIKELNAEKQIAESALADAREANIAKSRFLAAASHDLRQPLHALGLFLGNLSLMIKDDASKRLLNRICTTSNVLSEHFNSLLDLSRFDVGGVRVERRNFNINKLLENAAEEFRPEAEQKGLVLSVDLESCLVSSDQLLIERLVRNLITNAIRYTHKGSVSILTERDENVLRVAIVDTGLGISTEKQEEIFEEFVQLNNPARQRSQGVGLGLSIVKRISNLLDLKLKLQSQLGLGSRFEFELPIAHLDDSPFFDQEPVEQAMAPVRALNRCVWILEDDELIIEALRGQLEAWGCLVFSAQSRTELQKEYLACKRWPDFALIDDMLSEDENGLDIARWLSNFLSPNQIVIVTGNTADGRIDEIEKAGFRVVLKPMSVQALAGLLNNTGIDV